MIELNGAFIRDFRAKYEMSREELARELWVSPTTVWRWEHDRTKPSGLAGSRFLALIQEKKAQDKARIMEE